MNELMNVKEAAKYLRVNYMTVYKLVKKKRIPATKVGGNWRFKQEILDEWLLRNINAGEGSILVIDDDVEANNTLKEITQKQGYSVSSVTSVEAALNEINRQRFDLVLINSVLSGTNGRNGFKSIKDKAQDATVIMITDNTEDSNAQKALLQGPVLLIQKPYKEKDLIEVLNIVMKGINI